MSLFSYISSWIPGSAADTPVREQKQHHKRASGAALETVQRHSDEHELKLYGGCFCPFVQRVWITLEFKGIGYQYIEVDPYAKPASLLAINPLGLIPALEHGSFSCHESTVLVQYLEEAFPETPSLFPADAQGRAHVRLWFDHFSKKVLPLFYKMLQAQEQARQIEAATELKAELGKLAAAADAEGPFFAGPQLGWLDVMIAPSFVRFSRVLKPYRGWPDAEPGSRLARWVDAIESCPAVKSTVSTDELYLDSYERYAENRPNTSQIATAINAGKALP